MSEVRERFEEVLDRARMLSASDEQLDWLRDNWWSLDDEEQESIFRMNDRLLGAYVHRPIPKAPSATPEVDKATAQYRDSLRAHEDEDWGLLAMPMGQILQTVGFDKVRADRLLRLERTTHEPRATLIRALEKVMDE
jgi:hypothetical protein